MVYPTLPEETKAQCRAALQQVYDELTANRAEYEARSSAERFRDAQFSARIVLQSEERRGSDNPFAVRDRYMAENLSWVLEQRGPAARAVVWAHNGHAGVVRFPEFQSMGAHLKDKYGSEMLALGFSFYNGSFNARKLNGRRVGAVEPQTVDASPPGSYNHYFHTAGLPIFLLDLRGASPGTSATDWLFDHRRMWSIGSVVGDTTDTMSTEMRITDTFDLLIHIDRINPTTLR
jgi:erythromycin esterase